MCGGGDGVCRTSQGPSRAPAPNCDGCRGPGRRRDRPTSAVRRRARAPAEQKCMCVCVCLIYAATRFGPLDLGPCFLPGCTCSLGLSEPAPRRLALAAAPSARRPTSPPFRGPGSASRASGLLSAGGGKSVCGVSSARTQDSGLVRRGHLTTTGKQSQRYCSAVSLAGYMDLGQLGLRQAG